MLKKIDHIGIAVKSLEATAAFFQDVLGLRCEKIETVEAQKVRTAHYPIDDTHLELLEATSEESPQLEGGGLFLNRPGKKRVSL
jgi:catechol 2,3-dioxygenase-like lactoylglutathione lyase family enzyme